MSEPKLSFAWRETHAREAWKKWAGDAERDGTDFRAGYHRGVIEAFNAIREHERENVRPGEGR